MSRLEELIQIFCPNGVARKAFCEFGRMIRGNGLQKTDFTDKGVGCIHYGQIYTYYGSYAYETKSYVHPELAAKLQKVNTGDLVIAITSENVEDVCKCVAWLGDDEIVTGGHAAIFKHNQDPKYLSYYLQTEDFFTQKKKIAYGIKVIEISPQKLEQVRVPLPPLPVQREIVRILDNFSEITTKLAENLAAELAARQKQYEYYRNLLLTFFNVKNKRADPGIAVEWLALDETCRLKAGKAISTNEINDYLNSETPFPCYGGNGLRGYVKTFNQIGNVPLIGRQGALCGNVCFATGKFYATEHAVVVTPTERYNPRFLYHLLVAADLNQYKTAGAQPGLSVARLERIELPVPSLQDQSRIVSILDRYDTLCNDLKIGLYAEIEAQRKQYEYFREKLLTFKELSA